MGITQKENAPDSSEASVSVLVTALRRLQLLLLLGWRFFL
jgi:hypothetical protein